MNYITSIVIIFVIGSLSSLLVIAFLVRYLRAPFVLIMVDCSAIIFNIFLMVNDNFVTYFTISSHFGTVMARLTLMMVVVTNFVYACS